MYDVGWMRKKLTFLPTSDGSLPETRQLGARDIPTTKNRISRWTKRSPSLPYLKVAFFSFFSSLLFSPPHRHNSGHRALPLPPSHTVHCSTPARPAAAPGNSGRRAPEGGKKRKKCGLGRWRVFGGEAVWDLPIETEGKGRRESGS